MFYLCFKIELLLKTLKLQNNILRTEIERRRERAHLQKKTHINKYYKIERKTYFRKIGQKFMKAKDNELMKETWKKKQKNKQ